MQLILPASSVSKQYTGDKNHIGKREIETILVFHKGQKNPHNLLPLQHIFYIPHYLILYNTHVWSLDHLWNSQTFRPELCPRTVLKWANHLESSRSKNILVVVIWEEKNHIEFSEFSIFCCKCPTTKSYRMISLSQNLLSINLRAYFSLAFKQMASISLVMYSLFILFLYHGDTD